MKTAIHAEEREVEENCRREKGLTAHISLNIYWLSCVERAKEEKKKGSQILSTLILTGRGAATKVS